jgi:[ribosomal protein S5]-alanine N-acetyltransferase
MITIFQQSDSHDVKKLYRDVQVRKYLGGIQHEDSIELALNELVNSLGDSFYWVVREKYTDDFIGLMSLDPHHDGDYLEISYQLLPKWWRKGYATEVIPVIIKYALNDLNLSKIVAETQTANTSSCRLLERVGMQLEGTITRFGKKQAIDSITLSD